ncbi:MAG: hypothetical protein KDA81_17245 [Planctomycetaceae bacterium]|nr:hypothetical protein [Planctomycetaceae bacterium]
MFPRNVCFGSLILFLTTGCGGGPSDAPDLGHVTGVVTIDGKPASGVDVSFAPLDGGRPSSARTDANGRYDLVYSTSAMGAKIGMHKVKIAGAANAATEAWEEDWAKTSDVPLTVVPKEYAETEKRAEVKEGINEVDLTYP